MPLDPQARALLEQMQSRPSPPPWELPISVVRENVHAMTIRLGGPSETVARVENRITLGPAGDIPVRIYTPFGTGPFPLLIFFHGGAWVSNDLDTYDVLCRSLTNGASCVVVSVDYRLAPEHKFPAAVEDCFAATQWVAANATGINGDVHRIAVGGDSAGGNLAAAVTLLARDQGGPSLIYQVLIYPDTDYYLPGTPSLIENGKGYMVSKDMVIWAWDSYLPKDVDLQNPLAFPLRATDLSRLPRALIITAEFDPLRDEGERYATRLQADGVPVTLTRYDGMMHGFISMAGVLNQGKRGIAEVAAGLREAFAL